MASWPAAPDQTRESIREVRARTDRPFGIGVTLMMPGAAENAAIALEEKVPVVNFQLGRGEWLIEGVHAYGGKAIPTVTSARHAQSAAAAGADAVLVTGHEAAAHGQRVTSLVLVREVANAVQVPIVAAGGFADGQGLLAALAPGADGIAMGTRFAATQESGLHPDMKKTITEKNTHETLYTDNFDGMWARIMETPKSAELTRKPMSFLESAWRAPKSARALGMPLSTVAKGLYANPQRIRMLAHFGASMPYVERATLQGDSDTGVQFIGQSQGLVEDVPSAADLLARTVAEAKTARAQLSSS